uniref:Retroviral polymerase SH3-like domain-containing protein n=1 Tax=Tanacetum cinerariifolium TaxID=118510 RepID=A0A699KCN8_TANCI|nr:hypothetical protein [Tanacetum cinerariifolium]
MEITVAGGPAVGMKPLPVGTLVSPASTVVASIEVKTLAVSFESLLILSAAASPSLLLLTLIGSSSLDCLVATASLSSKTWTLQTHGSGISNLLAVGTTFTGSGNFYCQWELSPGSGNALCILFPTKTSALTTTTTHLPPPQPQQSTTDSMFMKRIGELEQIMMNLIQDNKNLEESFFIISSIVVQTPDSGISNLLAVGTTFTGSRNLYCHWKLSPGSGNALCILFPTVSMGRGCGNRFLYPKSIHHTTSKNLGKLQPKADIGIFIGYTPTKKAFRIYNRRLVQKPSSSIPYIPPSINDWDFLFQPMLDELLNPSPCVDHHAPEVIAMIVEVISPVQADSIGLPSSTSVDQDAPSPSKSHTTPETQSSVIPQDVKEDNIDIEVARMGNDPLFGVPIPEITSDQSSSTVSLHTIVQTDHRIPQHISKWTKDHPPDNIIGQLSRPVSIRLQLHEQALFCYYDAFLTSVEPKTYKDALTQSC